MNASLKTFRLFNCKLSGLFFPARRATLLIVLIYVGLTLIPLAGFSQTSAAKTGEFSAEVAGSLTGVSPDGWTEKKFGGELNTPPALTGHIFAVSIYVPDSSPLPNAIELKLGDAVTKTFELKRGLQTYTIGTEDLTKLTPGLVVFAAEVAKTFRAPGDKRDLGVVLREVGFKEAGK
ncbi:MAG TPA: hypothetical protein VIT91_03970 [Chthoniobacterales bacterium]